MARKRVTVTQESGTGRNQRFHDNYNGNDMSRRQFVSEINQGNYPKYHVRTINGWETPAPNPGKTRNNNLG